MVVLNVEPDVRRVLAEGFADADGHFRRDCGSFIQHTGERDPRDPDMRGEGSYGHGKGFDGFFDNSSGMWRVVHAHE